MSRRKNDIIIDLNTTLLILAGRLIGLQDYWCEGEENLFRLIMTTWTLFEPEDDWLCVLYSSDPTLLIPSVISWTSTIITDDSDWPITAYYAF